MKLQAKYVFIFNFIIAIFFGLGFMFIPDILMTMIGFSGIADGPNAFRFFGIVVFGAGILTFLVRNEGESNARKLINIFLLVFGDITNLMLWFTFILHILMIIAYGYVLIKN